MVRACGYSDQMQNSRVECGSSRSSRSESDFSSRPGHLSETSEGSDEVKSRYPDRGADCKNRGALGQYGVVVTPASDCIL